jgi:general secretion pathway protein D
VQRLASIIARIDTVSDNSVEMIPLQHANAAELARTLTQLADVKGAELVADAPKVFADERTNSILLSGGKSGRLRMRALITHLDTPLTNGGDTNVVYLHYANAKDLVPILRGVAATLTNEAPAGHVPAGDTAAAGAGAGAGAASGSIATIQAHDDNNALIISAPPAVFRSLQEVIRRLDVRRAQVLIEAVIAEVSEETANELGVQWQLPLGGPNDHVIGGTNFSSGNSSAAGNNILSAAINPLGVGNGFNLGYIDGTVTIGNVKIFQLGALVTALRSNGKNDVLSTPSVMTLDNQQAVIKVGQEVPFLTGAYQTTASSTVTVGGGNGNTTTGIANPFQTIQRKDVGLTLTVTPHINEGDSVKLEIHQEVSSLAPPVSGASDLVTNKREVQTTVLIKDDSVFVIGGLISDNVKDNAQSVPGLGAIPFFGNLFRYRSNDHQKQNLMVFLHPRILRDPASEASVSSEKYNFIRTEQLQMRESNEIVTPRHDMPMLPDVHDFLASPALDVAPKEPVKH